VGLRDTFKRQFFKGRIQRPWDQERIGQRLVIGRAGGGGAGNNTPPPVFWDRPEPELPPMQFPRIPGWDDPQVMLTHLEGLVRAGALDQEGLDRARDYLEGGG
jgi:hypothetical protein